MTLAGSVAAALQTSPRLQLTAEQVGLTGSAYLAGAVLGSLFFGHLTDRLGRKKLFNVTLGVYLVATAATAFSWDFYSFLFFRFLTGAGIGGEYSGDQLGDPGTDPGAAARPHRSRHQRQLLDRRGAAARCCRSGCSIRRCSIPTWAGAWPSAAARCSGW